jgi:hypothetical protein
MLASWIISEGRVVVDKLLGWGETGPIPSGEHLHSHKAGIHQILLSSPLFLFLLLFQCILLNPLLYQRWDFVITKLPSDVGVFVLPDVNEHVG